MESVTITPISRSRDSKELIRQYNWGFLKINPLYQEDYQSLVIDIADELGDSKWRVQSEKSEFKLPLKLTSKVDSLCKAFQRKWRISLPANPLLDLPNDVYFRQLKETVVSVTSPEQLNDQQEILAAIQSMTSHSYKNKSREKKSWADKKIYALMLVDLRWSNEQDVIEAYRAAKAQGFSSEKVSRNFSILEWKLQLMLSHPETFLSGTEFQIAELYSQNDTQRKNPRSPEDFRRESVTDKKKFNQFMNIAPLIPFSFRSERIRRKE